MEDLFKISLVIHIISGFVSFVVAPIAMIVKKGGKNHRLFGKIFFWCMTGVVSSAFVMSVLHSNPFLFMVSGFSYYLIASGYRWIYRKKVKSVIDVAFLDWALIVCAALFNISLFVYGCYLINTTPQNPFSYISAFFGLLGLYFVFINFRQYFHPPKDNYAWLLNHIGGMCGGYIATVSAFSAVNLNFLPTIIQWMWASVIGVPLLFVWINYYHQKLKNGKPVNQLVVISGN